MCLEPQREYVMTTHAPRLPFERTTELGPPPEFAALRAEQSLRRVGCPFGGDAWLATRYADVRKVYADPRFSRAATVNADVPRVSPAQTPPGGLFAMDPPEHSRLRKLVAGTFTMKNVQRWRPRTEQIVDGLVAGMREHGSPVDLVHHFSVPLPVTVICELLGVPATDRGYFERLSRLMLSTTAATGEEIDEAIGTLLDYLGRHVAERRARPSAQRSRDLLTDLVEARDESDRLSEQELVQMGVDLLVAGHETTANQLSNFTFTLLDTGLWSQLVEEPGLLDTAVEELLRYVHLVNGGTTRIALEDVEFDGTVVRAGEAVIAAIGSANHDETVFEEPGRIKLDRYPNPHVGFGHGVHHCLGAQLARLELRAGLGALLREFPTLRPAGEKRDVPWREGQFVHGPTELMVAW